MTWRLPDERLIDLHLKRSTSGPVLTWVPLEAAGVEAAATSGARVEGMARVVEGLEVDGLDSAGVVGGVAVVEVELSKASKSWKDVTPSSSSASPSGAGAFVMGGTGEVTAARKGVCEVDMGAEVLLCPVALRSCSMPGLARWRKR